MSHRRSSAAAANGFIAHSLRVDEAEALWRNRYPVLPDYRCPSGGWRMARNSVPVLPVPMPGGTKWHDAIQEVRRGLTPEERRSHLWRTSADNESWWADHLAARWQAAMDSEENMVYPSTRKWNAAGRERWWGVPGRTLENVLAHIAAGGEHLEMPPTPPPSPPRPRLNPWLPRSGTSGSSSSRASQSSSSSGPARSSPLSARTRASPYLSQAPRRHNPSRGIVIAEPQGLRRPKEEVVDYAEEARLRQEREEYERQQRRLASFDDPEDYPGQRAAALASIKEERQAEERRRMAGPLKDALRASILDTGRTFVDLEPPRHTNDDEADPSNLAGDAPEVKQEPDDAYYFDNMLPSQERQYFRRHGGGY